MSRFVRPDTTVLPLSNGDTITVKTRLNWGQQHDAHGRMYTLGSDGVLHVNPSEIGFAMVVAYLVDWTLADDDGHVVPIRGIPVADLETILRTLDPESFGEIADAINEHETRTRATRDQEKKPLGGMNGVETTWPLPSGADGASSGSVS
jgi:hypothetical protein